LYQRKQKVINRATSSTVCEVSAGVPKVSVLGPLLFLVYINDIGEKLLSLSRLFADDTSRDIVSIKCDIKIISNVCIGK
jgi:hypothetical protein